MSYVLAVAVDYDGNPVLLGTTFSLVEGVGVPGDWDFFAIKLDGETGGELWRTQGGGGLPFTREGLRGAKVRARLLKEYGVKLLSAIGPILHQRGVCLSA